MHLSIRGESNLRYDETVLITTKKHGISTACVHTAEDLFRNMKKDATWIHDIRMNVKENFKTRTVQISLSPELQTCEPKELK